MNISYATICDCGTRKTGGFFSRFFKCHELVTFGAEFSGNFLWLVTFLCGLVVTMGLSKRKDGVLYEHFAND